MPNITTNYAITYTNLQFYMPDKKITIATLRTSQCQGGVMVSIMVRIWTNRA